MPTFMKCSPANLGGSNVINFQRLDSRAASILAVVEISRVHIRGEVHWLLAGTREHVGVELLHAEVRFEYGLTAHRAAFVNSPEETALFVIGRDLFGIEGVEACVSQFFGKQ